jgi:AraC family transcriptional regulator
MTPPVRIVQFPGAKVAVVEHRGPPEEEYASALRLVAWRQRNGLPPDRHQSFGVHYTDPRRVAPSAHRVDFCVSFDGDVAPNPEGVIEKFIPPCRCAVATHLGPRDHNLAAVYLWEQWLPASGERPGGFPMFFHYVNVGPQVRPDEMVTDVYLPLR